VRPDGRACGGHDVARARSPCWHARPGAPSIRRRRADDGTTIRRRRADAANISAAIVVPPRDVSIRQEQAAKTQTTPRAVVLGDLILDVVLAPSRSLRSGTDVSGRVAFRQGGSAATTSRVFVQVGLDTSLVTALGPDGLGDALARYMGSCGVEVRAARIAGSFTGRMGVMVETSGERTFVADRGAMLRLRPRHLRTAWFKGADLLHVPAYSMLGDGLAATSIRAAALVRQGGAKVSIDLSSAGFLEDFGVENVLQTAAEMRPDVILANQAETVAAARGRQAGVLLELAPIVVLKRGASGASVLARSLPGEIVVPARQRRVADSTGAGDGFNGGFLAVWLRDELAGLRPDAASLARAVRAGHLAAAREVGSRRVEFKVGDLLPAEDRLPAGK
jgi:ribokinase